MTKEEKDYLIKNTDPDTFKDLGYYLGRSTDAFNIMRNLGLGILNKNFGNL